MKYFTFILLIPLFTFAGDAQHRSNITSLALASAIDRPIQNIFWISAFSVNLKNEETFLNSSGATILPVKKVISSSYDTDVTYDISNFYENRKSRIKLIANFKLSSNNTTYSVGIDSGVAASKINIQKSFFVGATHVIQLNKQSHMVWSTGSWFGGSIKESPCLDSYDREYWCQNLTAWADYKPVYPKNFSYIDIKYIYRF